LCTKVSLSFFPIFLDLELFVSIFQVHCSQFHLSSQEKGTLELINNTLHHLQKNSIPVKFQWVLSHAGIFGNEETDSLKNEGSRMKQFNNLVKFISVKNKIELAAKEQKIQIHQIASEGKCWEKLLTTRIASEQKILTLQISEKKTGLRKHT
jgi:hypothetical protein